MNTWTLQHVIDATGAVLLAGSPQQTFSSVALDTRVPLAQGALFFALKGPRHDAHDHLHELSGAVVVSSLEALEPTRFNALLLVPDTLVALQQFAAFHREQMPAKFVGITGSNGKTEVKEMLRAIFSHTSLEVAISPGSYNSQVGVALSLLQVQPHHEVAVIEAGISQPGEMERLASMIQPDFGILTNVGDAHFAGLGSLEVTATEKLKLFSQSSTTLIYPASDPTLQGLMPLNVAKSYPFDVHPPTITLPLSSDLLSLHFRAKHQWHNATAAASLAQVLGVEPETIESGLRSWAPAHDRLEIHTTPRGVTLINDAYNADPTSTRAALGVLAQQGPQGLRVAVLGSMLDLGSFAHEAHRLVGENVAQVADRLIVMEGTSIKALVEGAKHAGMRDQDIFMAANDAEIAHKIRAWTRSGDTVLFKASRAIGLDRAADLLLESLGPTRLEIDLGAIRHNYHALKQHLPPKVQIMAVVKSFGYGNDANRVALTLLGEGVTALAVAYADEGVALREYGIPKHVPILVTNTLIEEVDKIVRYDLTALVDSSALFLSLEQIAKEQERHVACHIELDTGMRRAGVRPEALDEMLTKFSTSSHLQLTGLMTHLAAADMPEHDEWTQGQVAQFDQAIAQAKAQIKGPLICHAANTAAAWRLPQAHYDMVRLGLGLYGISPSEAVHSSMRATRNALKMISRVIHITTLTPGESVSYGRHFIATKPMRVATIALGYNDGFSRRMSNGGEVLVRGQLCQVVGKVCMDVTVVDVTALPEVEVGDDVVIFGDEEGRVTLDGIAKRCDTISYEVLCNISRRVRRVFLGLREV